MTLKSKAPKHPVLSVKKLYRFIVDCSFDFDYAFDKSGVEQDPGGDGSDVCPTEAALTALGRELAEVLGLNYVTSRFQASTEPEDLSAVDGGDGSYTFKVYCSFELLRALDESKVQVDVCPTDVALTGLERELAEMLGYNYAISEVEASAEANSFLGVESGGQFKPRPARRRVRKSKKRIR